jgi:hypothetical protein
LEILEIAKQFAVIAPKADAYRYPIDRQGNHGTPHQIVNLGALHDSLDDLMKKLRGIDETLMGEKYLAEEEWELSEEFESLMRDYEVGVSSRLEVGVSSIFLKN